MMAWLYVSNFEDICTLFCLIDFSEKIRNSIEPHPYTIGCRVRLGITRAVGLNRLFLCCTLGDRPIDSFNSRSRVKSFENQLDWLLEKIDIVSSVEKWATTVYSGANNMPKSNETTMSLRLKFSTR